MSVQKARWLLVVVILIVKVMVSFPIAKVFAETSCSASLTPVSVDENSNALFTFTLTNTSDESWAWINIGVPNSANYTIQDASINGWNFDENGGDYAIFTGSTGPYETAVISMNVAIGDIGGTLSDRWVIEVATDTEASSPVVCSGDLSSTILAEGTDALSISPITITNVTATSVTLSWTTNIDSSHVVQYGIASSLSEQSANSSMTTQHTVTLDDLIPNTTYSFFINATDNANTTVQTNTNSFTTAKESTNTTTTTVQTITVNTTTVTTQVITPIPTATPMPDRTSPIVRITTTLSDIYTQSPVITGTAYDGSRVKRVQYSIDGGKNWGEIPIKEQGSVSWSFSIPDMLDGNYVLQIRAIDTRDNIGYSAKQQFVIDKLPPKIGGSVITIGPQVLSADTEGNVVGMVGVPLRLTFSAIGGPTIINITAGRLKFPAVMNNDTGLWTSTLQFKEPGNYLVSIYAVDGAGNETTHKLLQLIVVPQGEVGGVEKTDEERPVISLYAQEPVTKTWSMWDGASYGQKNPQRIQKDGRYGFYVPPGTYYLTLQGKNIRTQTTSFRAFSSFTPINTLFSVESNSFIEKKIFQWLSIPAFGKEVPFTVQAVPPREMTRPMVIGTEAASITLPDSEGNIFDVVSLRGKSAILTFGTTWSPTAFQQIAVYDSLPTGIKKRLITVLLQEAVAQVYTFQKRGGYENRIVVDSMSSTMGDYPVSILPTHYILDEKGIITAIRYGILSKEEVERYLGTGQ